jgi:Na+:H+ antiporter, NhaA family
MARLADALRSDLVSGSLLIIAAVVALAWANSPLAPAYEALGTFTAGPAPHVPPDAGHRR